MSQEGYIRPQKLLLKVTLKVQPTANIIKLRLEGENPILFAPGQFMTIFVDKYTRRSYSISSVSGLNYVETYNDITPGGPGSQYFINAEVGDTIEVMLPLGRFVYKAKPGPVVFIATGTGITPFLAMLETALKINKSQRQIHLVWGCRFEKDFFVKEQLEDYANTFPNFKYSLCVSRERIVDMYQGRVTGLITETEYDPECSFYICGGQEMIKDAENILSRKGFSKTQIYYEQFY